jgi:hypothetical protein
MHFPKSKIVSLLNDNTSEKVTETSIEIRPRIISITPDQFTKSDDDGGDEPQTVTYYLSSFGGILASEKWMDITTVPQDDKGSANYSQYWAQTRSGGRYVTKGDRQVQGDGAGLINTVAINFTVGETYYINAYDKYDDGWDNTDWILTDAAENGNTIAIRENPTDGINNNGNSWEVDDRYESSTEILVRSTKTEEVSSKDLSESKFDFIEPKRYFFGDIQFSSKDVKTVITRIDNQNNEFKLVDITPSTLTNQSFKNVLFNKIHCEHSATPDYTLNFYGCEILIP